MVLSPNWVVTRFNDETGLYEPLCKNLWAEWECQKFAEGYLKWFPDAKLMFVHNP